MAEIKTLHFLMVFLSLSCTGTSGSLIFEGPGIREDNRGEGTYKLSFGDRRMAFNDWKANFAHIQGDNWDEEERFVIFSGNVAKIERHNLLYHTNRSSFFMGLNQFAAMTVDEYKRYNHLGQYATKWREFPIHEQVLQSGQPRMDQEFISEPDHVDWTAEGYVTPVKDQGNCGSCWIFSATGAMEGAYYKAHRHLKSFSEQQILECCQLEGCSNSCDVGGYPEAALNYVYNQRGIETEHDYPYKPYKISDCHANKRKEHGSLTAIREVLPHKSESALKTACVNNGPISVSISAVDTFRFYTGGVYDDPECDDEDLDHAVLVTGYSTTQDGKDYWIIKNSWNVTWGQKGYGWMVRNKDNRCGIATKAVYPIFT